MTSCPQAQVTPIFTASSALPSRTSSWRSRPIRLLGIAPISFSIILNFPARLSPRATVQIKSLGSILAHLTSNKWSSHKFLKGGTTTGGPCLWQPSVSARTTGPRTPSSPISRPNSSPAYRVSILSLTQRHQISIYPSCTMIASSRSFMAPLASAIESKTAMHTPRAKPTIPTSTSPSTTPGCRWAQTTMLRMYQQLKTDHSARWRSDLLMHHLTLWACLSISITMWLTTSRQTACLSPSTAIQERAPHSPCSKLPKEYCASVDLSLLLKAVLSGASSNQSFSRSFSSSSSLPSAIFCTPAILRRHKT